MKTYLATFKPLEPYFFGNEKSFTYADPQVKAQTTVNNYFIKGETVPSQSTVLGALRYLFLAVRKSNWEYDETEKKLNAEAVGRQGFDPAQNRTFGKIKKISPVFLVGEKGIYVPTPFDHRSGCETYTPFGNYQSVQTPEGEKLFTTDYVAKDGVTNSYMALSDGSITEASAIFRGVERVGINRDKNGRVFFKRENKLLAEGFSFGVYVSLEDGLLPCDEILFLGQNKSAFAVSFAEEENTISEKMAAYLREDVIYCFGDVFTSADVYKQSLFSVTKLKSYRAFSKTGKRVHKDSYLYKLITAGSIFIPEDKAAFLQFVQNENVNRIGYNEFITK